MRANTSGAEAEKTCTMSQFINVRASEFLHVADRKDTCLSLFCNGGEPRRVGEGHTVRGA